MNKLMKKAVIFATVATMALSATTASASFVPSKNCVDQYDVKAGEHYILDIKGNSLKYVVVTEVFEKEAKLYGTNRTIKWIDTHTGNTGESTLGDRGNTTVYEPDTMFTEP